MNACGVGNISPPRGFNKDFGLERLLLFRRDPLS
jgi:hypothetical protein